MRLALIKNPFHQGDVEDILSIPLSQFEFEDEITWSLKSKGVFTVKSAYHLAINVINLASEALGSDDGGQKKL